MCVCVCVCVCVFVLFNRDIVYLLNGIAGNDMLFESVVQLTLRTCSAVYFCLWFTLRMCCCLHLLFVLSTLYHIVYLCVVYLCCLHVCCLLVLFTCVLFTLTTAGAGEARPYISLG